MAGGLALPATLRNVTKAVRRNRTLSSQGLQERLFSVLFSGLVYAQIWEDPVVDLDALRLAPGARIITIASGGCNALAYLAADPDAVVAVDLNGHHIALNHLKIATLRCLPDHEALFRFLGGQGGTANESLYERYIQSNLDPTVRAYWDGRLWNGRRRIDVFSKSVYHTGLLGRFIQAGHAVARLYGRDPAKVLAARDIEEQRQLFDQEIRPVLRSRLLRAALRSPVSLYGLGIPPAQYAELLGSAPEGGTMADVVEARLERLACGFPFETNYFAWQAFGRKYPCSDSRALPAHLQRQNFETFKARADRIELRHANLVECLENAPPSSFDAFVLLDSQDWMDDGTIARLWRAIGKTSRPGARVIFRTAAVQSPLAKKLPPEIQCAWTYAVAESRRFTDLDRSAIYGGFHLYRLRRRDCR